MGPLPAFGDPLGGNENKKVARVLSKGDRRINAKEQNLELIRKALVDV
jgi:hypothetical protein